MRKLILYDSMENLLEKLKYEFFQYDILMAFNVFIRFVGINPGSEESKFCFTPAVKYLNKRSMFFPLTQTPDC